LIKLIHDLKKAQKTILKLKINLKLKIFRAQTRLVGFSEGKKKTPKLNSPHQMKPIETQIDHFDGRCQRHLFFSNVRIQLPFILFLKLETNKIKEIKF
jgi:hypothetical protein